MSTATLVPVCVNCGSPPGLSQQVLADLIGVTYQQAHKYETGVNRLAAVIGAD